VWCAGEFALGRLARWNTQKGNNLAYFSETQSEFSEFTSSHRVREKILWILPCENGLEQTHETHLKLVSH
jgi:hypothetical protein